MHIKKNRLNCRLHIYSKRLYPKANPSHQSFQLIATIYLRFLILFQFALKLKVRTYNSLYVRSINNKIVEFKKKASIGQYLSEYRKSQQTNFNLKR